MGEVRILTMVRIEPCRACNGKGDLGMLGAYRIICEACMMAGLDWRERGFLEVDHGESD